MASPRLAPNVINVMAQRIVKTLIIGNTLILGIGSKMFMPYNASVI